MKNEIKKCIAALIAALGATAMLTACDGKTGGPPEEPPHTEHTWETEYSYDDNGHYIKAICHPTEKKNEGAHEYDDDDDKTCNVCDYVRKVITGVTVNNKTDIESWYSTADKTLDIELEGDYTVAQALDAGLLKVTTSDNEVLVANGTTLHAVGDGTCTVTVTAGTHKETLNVTVMLEGIRITGTVDGHADGSARTIPTFTVRNGVGEYITEGVTLVDTDDDDAQISLTYNEANHTWGGTIASVKYIGKAHTLVISVDGEGDEPLYTAELKGNFYRQICSEHSGTLTRESTYTYEEAKQVVALHKTDNAYGKYNMAASTKYYAQVEIKLEDIDKIRYAGLVSIKSMAADYMWQVIKKVDGAYKMLVCEYNVAGAWSFTEADANVSVELSDDVLERDDGRITVGQVRDGDMYYFFVNGNYVGEYKATRYGGDELTTPGPYMHGGGCDDLVYMYDLAYYGGDDVDDYVEENVPEITSFAVNNKTEIESWKGENDIDIAVTLGGDITAAQALGGRLTVTSSDSEVVSVHGLTLHTEAEGICTITVKCGDSTETINVNVIKTGFKLTGTTMSGNAAGTNINIPSFQVRDNTGALIKTGVTAVDDDDDAAVINLTCDADGNWSGTIATTKYIGRAHNISLSAPNGEGQPYTATLALNAYRPIIGTAGQGCTRENSWTYNTEQQQLGLQNTGNTFGQFYTASSTKHYAQATYTLADVDKVRYIGLASFRSTNADWMWHVLKKVDGVYKMLVCEYANSGAWSFNEADAQLTIELSAELLERADGRVTVGQVRDGDMYYFFVNGSYVGEYKATRFGGEALTTPGVYMHGGGCNETLFVYDLVYYGGDDVDDYVEENVPAITSLTVTNKTEIESWKGENDIDVAIALNEGMTVAQALGGRLSITSSNSAVVSVRGTKLHTEAEGVCTITVKCGELTETISVNVIQTGFKLSADAVLGNNGGRNDGANIALPSFTVKDNAGNAVTVASAITATDEDDANAVINLTYADGKFSGTLSTRVYTGAAHTITLSYGDYTAEITVDVFRQTPKSGVGELMRHADKTYDTDAQLYYIQNSGNGTSQFDMELSEKYFVQERMIASEIDAVRYAGFMHVNGVGMNGTKWMWSVVRKTSAGYVLLVYEQSASGWSFDENNPTVSALIPTSLIGDGHITLQCARDGGKYYFFVNDTYMCELASAYYGAGTSTIPGAYIHGGSNGTPRVYFDHVRFTAKASEVDAYLTAHKPADLTVTDNLIALYDFSQSTNKGISGRYTVSDGTAHVADSSVGIVIDKEILDIINAAGGSFTVSYEFMDNQNDNSSMILVQSNGTDKQKDVFRRTDNANKLTIDNNWATDASPTWNVTNKKCRFTYTYNAATRNITAYIVDVETGTVVAKNSITDDKFNSTIDYIKIGRTLNRAAYAGNIDDLMIYNKALSESEVTAL